MKDIIITGITILGGGVITIIVTMIQNRKLDKKPLLNGKGDYVIKEIERIGKNVDELSSDMKDHRSTEQNQLMEQKVWNAKIENRLDNLEK